MPCVRLMPSNRWKRNEGRSLRICCWCDDETGAEEPSIELSADDKIKLGKMVAEFCDAAIDAAMRLADAEQIILDEYVQREDVPV